MINPAGNALLGFDRVTFADTVPGRFVSDSRVAGVGVLPLIPILLGASLLGGGFLGYKLAKPAVDPQTGERIPGPLESGARALGQGVGNAITWLSIIAAAYFIFREERKRRG